MKLDSFFGSEHWWVDQSLLHREWCDDTSLIVLHDYLNCSLLMSHPKLESNRKQESSKAAALWILWGQKRNRCSKNSALRIEKRLEAFFSSVRNLEKRMAETEKWATLPKPEIGHAAD